MDTLALLCNLYGDGPQTLRRLREAGCGSLANLETLESERLASLLRTSVRSARRFQAEGRLLRERSEGSVERASTRRSSAGPVAQPSPPKDVLVASVLSAWRERDAHASEGAFPGVALAVDVPRAPLPAPRDGLEGLDGMDAELLGRLRECGVDSLAALREVDVLDLAGRRVAGFTRLLHLQFLARRTAEAGTHAAGAFSPCTDGPLPAPRGAAPTFETAGTPEESASRSQTGVPTCSGAPSAAFAVSAPEEERLRSPVVGDVLVPARALERRGPFRNALPAVQPSTPRFSPRSDPPAAFSPILEGELERHAAARRIADPSAPEGVPAQDDAGSSGPFA